MTWLQMVGEWCQRGGRPFAELGEMMRSRCDGVQARRYQRAVKTKAPSAGGAERGRYTCQFKGERTAGEKGARAKGRSVGAAARRLMEEGKKKKWKTAASKAPFLPVRSGWMRTRPTR